jgi:hypothetical protein
MGGIRYGLGHLDTLDRTFSVFRGVVTCWHSGPPKMDVVAQRGGNMSGSGQRIRPLKKGN